jgi:hypothetical protein
MSLPVFRIENQPKAIRFCHSISSEPGEVKSLDKERRGCLCWHLWQCSDHSSKYHLRISRKFPQPTENCSSLERRDLGLSILCVNNSVFVLFTPSFNSQSTATLYVYGEFFFFACPSTGWYKIPYVGKNCFSFPPPPSFFQVEQKQFISLVRWQESGCDTSWAHAFPVQQQNEWSVETVMYSLPGAFNTPWSKLRSYKWLNFRPYCPLMQWQRFKHVGKE